MSVLLQLKKHPDPIHPKEIKQSLSCRKLQATRIKAKKVSSHEALAMGGIKNSKNFFLPKNTSKSRI